MPIMKVKNGYKFGKHGKIYPTRKQALKQMRAIKANEELTKDKLTEEDYYFLEKFYNKEEDKQNG